MKQTASTIPKKMRAQMEADPFYLCCSRNAALHDHVCQGDPVRGYYGRMIEWEHALIYAGTKVQEIFAIIPICWWAHRGPGFNKEINVWIALNRATDAELVKLSEKGQDYIQYKKYLNSVYGVYNPSTTRGIEVSHTVYDEVDSDALFPNVY